MRPGSRSSTLISTLGEFGVCLPPAPLARGVNFVTSSYARDLPIRFYSEGYGARPADQSACARWEQAFTGRPLTGLLRGKLLTGPCLAGQFTGALPVPLVLTGIGHRPKENVSNYLWAFSGVFAPYVERGAAHVLNHSLALHSTSKQWCK